MKRRKLLMIGVPVVIVAALLLYGIVKRERALASLGHVAQAQSSIAAEIITPTPGPPTANAR